MADALEIARGAYEHIRYLVQQIGARPAGSEQEKRALDYAAEQLIRAGYTPQFMPVPFAPLPALYLENIIAGLVLICAGWFWPLLPWVTLLTPLVILAMPEIERLETDRRRRTQQSQNVIAYSEGRAELPLLIFCAHADSARAMTVDHPFWVSLFAQGMHLLQRVAILIALLSAATLLGFTLPPAVMLPTGLFASLVGGWFLLTDLANQLDRRVRYAPGALDNASGVGLLLALAAHFAETPPKRLQLGFLVTGAEETGLHGAQVYAAELANSGRKAALINLDMVGAGNRLLVVTRVGSLFAQDTSKVLNGLLFDVAPNASPVWYSLKSGDFAAFLQKGLAATSVQMAGSGAGETAYHTLRDGMEQVQVAALESCATALCRFVEMLPYSDWALK